MLRGNDGMVVSGTLETGCDTEGATNDSSVIANTRSIKPLGANVAPPPQRFEGSS